MVVSVMESPQKCPYSSDLGDHSNSPRWMVVLCLCVCVCKHFLCSALFEEDSHLFFFKWVAQPPTRIFTCLVRDPYK